ncbi:MAG: hypothetical protein MJ162_06530 [Treponema sp.]|nr:hypothetical protein [Treponema sp.]
MAKKTPGNFQDIHIEDYLAQYENTYATAENFMQDFGREKQSLNGQWNYAIDQYDTCLRQKWFKEYYKDGNGFTLPVDFDFDNWPTMPIPSCWNTFLPEYLLYEGTMVFTRKFDFDTTVLKNKKVFLKIGAVNYTTRLFLNKQYIGIHRGGSTPFFIDVTDKLQKENRIIICADSTRRPDQVPTENTDWFNYGGVYREVELIFVPQVFIKQFTLSLLSQNKSTLKATLTLSDSSAAGSGFVEIPELKLRKEIQIKDGKGKLSFTAKQLELWYPENPKLYEVKVTFGDDSLCDQIGFRHIEVKNREILLNGKPVFLKGISCHEESVANGKALTDEERIENIKLAKEMGCNYMRLAHYPHHENAARLADKLGILLWEEVPVYWAIKFNRKATYNDAENQLTELILRDINRASVIIWSVGNENADTDDRLTFMSKLAKTARKLDPSRLVSAACLVDHVHNVIADRLAEYLDVIGINEYYGWYDPDFKRLPELLENSNPSKPVIITEFGADALPDFHGPVTEKGNEEYQEWVYQKQTEYLADSDYVKGMTPWILYDFRCPRRTTAIQKYYNRKGLLSPDKKHRKKAFYILQKFYQQ